MPPAVVVIPWEAILPLYLLAGALLVVTVGPGDAEPRRTSRSAASCGPGTAERWPGSSPRFASSGYERTAALGLAVLVLVTAFVFALAPRVLDRVADDALRAEVAAATPAERNIQLLQERRVDADAAGGRCSASRRSASASRPSSRLPSGDLLVDRAYLAETSRWKIVSDAAEEHFAMLRFQPGLEDRIELVEGRLPSGATDHDAGLGARLERTTSRCSRSPSPCRRPRRSAPGSATLIRLQLDPSDRLNGYCPARPGPANRIALKVVGLYRVTDPDSPYWLGDTALAGPVLRVVSREVEFLDVTPLLSAEAYDAVHAS